MHSIILTELRLKLVDQVLEVMWHCSPALRVGQDY